MRKRALRRNPGPDPAAPREPGAAAAAPAAARPPAATLAIAALIIALAGAQFAQRAGRPIEQGGDAYSDGNALVAGEHFARLGFAKLRFLPVVVPQVTGAAPAPRDYYTHYPPGADLLNGVFRRLGVRDLADFRRISAAVSLVALVFWFGTLWRLFGEGTALIGLAAYAFAFPFVWLGDSVHHYAYSELLRLAALYLAVRAAAAGLDARRAIVLGAVLFLQSLFAFDFILYSQAVLLGLGVTGFRGDRLRRLALFAAMPALGFALHLAQNVWAMGARAGLDDMWSALLERAFSSGGGDFIHYTRWDMVRSIVRETGAYVGVGLGGIAMLAGIGAVAWAITADDERRWSAARLLGTLAAATALWYVVMYQHSAEHRYVIRHLLPLVSLAVALALRGLYALAAPRSRRLAYGVVGAGALLLAADGAEPYRRDATQRSLVSEMFAIAHTHGGMLPADRVIATNIVLPAPPALEALVNRPVHIGLDLADLETTYGRGARVTYLYSRASQIDPDLLSRLRAGSLIAKSDMGAIVDVTLP
jgi:hypothetical protein